MPNTNGAGWFLKGVSVVMLLLLASVAVPGSYIATNPLKGCSVDGANMMTCPGGFSTGSAGGFDSIQLAGSISGVATIVPPAVAGMPSLTLPTVSGGFVITSGPQLATTTPAAGVIPKVGSDGSLSPGFLQFIGGGQIPLSGLEFKRAFAGNLSNGTTDIYTAPALKRAYIRSFQAFNSTVGSIVVSVSLKSSGTYYRLTNNQTVTTLNNTALIPGIVLEPGESVAVVTDATGLNAWFRIEEYDSSVPLYSPRLISVASGDNTLYTVPPSKSAIVLGGSTSTSGVGTVFASNATAGTRTYKYYVVSSGGVTGTNNQITGATVLTNTVATAQSFGTMATGDFIVYNTDAATAGQVVWTVVIEKTL